MDEGMLARRGLLMRLSRRVISHIAPEELALFDRFAAEYFRDPTPPTLAREPDEDPLAAGFGEFLAMATPAALAMTNAALTYIQSKASNSDTSPPTSIIQTVLRDQGHRAAVRQQAYDAGVL